MAEADYLSVLDYDKKEEKTETETKKKKKKKNIGKENLTNTTF